MPEKETTVDLVWIITKGDGTTLGEHFTGDFVPGTREDAREAFVETVNASQREHGGATNYTIGLDDIPTEPGQEVVKSVPEGYITLTCLRVCFGIRENQLHERHAQIEAEMMELEGRQSALRQEPVQIEEELGQL
jgi:hypothetical protein